MKKPNQKTWDILESSAFHISLNANDFFGYACADAVKLSNCDFKWALPIIEEFGWDGLHAVMAYIEDCQPIIEIITPTYMKARNKIIDQQPLIYSKIDEWPTELAKKILNGKETATREEQKGEKRHG